MRIGCCDLSKDVFVIAEVGNNHEGDFELAKKLVALAAQAGADAVKFQTIVPDRLVSAKETARIEQLKKFQFSYDQFAELKRVADQEDIMFLSTPFDIESAAFLNTIVPAFKIASGDNNFFPLIEKIASFGKPIIMSTGLADFDEISRAKDLITRTWQAVGAPTDQLALLHCVASYPAPAADANLRAITDLQRLGVVPGYSDHTLGINAVVGAVALGARVVEKHFTINKNHSAFRDHQLSADPADLKEMVLRIREMNQMLGGAQKVVAPSEKDNVVRMRRSIVAKHPLKAGHALALSDLDWVRPGGGVAPGKEAELTGKQLTRDVAKGEQILLGDLK